MIKQVIGTKIDAVKAASQTIKSKYALYYFEGGVLNIKLLDKMPYRVSWDATYLENVTIDINGCQLTLTGEKLELSYQFTWAGQTAIVNGEKVYYDFSTKKEADNFINDFEDGECEIVEREIRNLKTFFKKKTVYSIKLNRLTPIYKDRDGIINKKTSVWCFHE